MTLAYWCVLAAAMLPYLTVGIAKALGSYDNANPRAPGTYDGLALRAHSAHQNGLEAFPFFAAAVIVASGANAMTASATLDRLALAWIVLRLVYTAVYLSGLATLRSIVWIAGWAVTIAIFTMPAWRG